MMVSFSSPPCFSLAIRLQSLEVDLSQQLQQFQYEISRGMVPSIGAFLLDYLFASKAQNELFFSKRDVSREWYFWRMLYCEVR